MKKSVFIISLFLIGTAFSVNAQEMTQIEKNNYAFGIMLGQKINDEIQKSGVDLSIFESVKEKLKEKLLGKVDFEYIIEGFRDIMKGESKLSKEEIISLLSGLEKEKDNFLSILNINKNNENENENENQTNTNTSSSLSRLANNYGSISWQYLCLKEYSQSKKAALRALELDHTQTWVKVNLAHALLFQKKFSKAETIYKELKQTASNGRGYSEVILKDFDDLENANLIPEKFKADVEKIRTMLKK